MITDCFNDSDLKRFEVLQKKYELPNVTDVILKYNMIVEFLHERYPDLSNKWYNEQAYNRTDMYLNSIHSNKLFQRYIKEIKKW